jgi:tRNA-splicing ligase RtcB (3'-phosphate/5'-hydroxy nucleic acid ligase)
MVPSGRYRGRPILSWPTLTRPSWRPLERMRRSLRSGAMRLPVRDVSRFMPWTLGGAAYRPFGRGAAPDAGTGNRRAKGQSGGAPASRVAERWKGPLREVGPALQEIPQDYRGLEGNLRMRVPGLIVAQGELLRHIQDDMAPEQVANVATLPGIVGHSLAMPDIHWGYGFPIGGVAAFDPDAGGVVSPGGVGFDINCGVRLLRTPLEERDVRERLPELVDALFDAVPCGMGSRGGIELSGRDLDGILDEGAAWAVANGWASAADREHMEERGAIAGARSAAVHERARVRGERSLGSLGSGNHFLELQVVDEVFDEAACKAFGVRPGQVCIMIHTGSRGLGHQVCEDHVRDLQPVVARHGIELPDRQLACAPLGTREADTYLAAMASAANFAFVNRSVIATHARRVLARTFGIGEEETEVIYDVCHNIAKMEEHIVPSGPEAGRRKRLCVHRKGATRCFGPGHKDVPAAYRAVGQPVLVPGDMGRMSFLLAGNTGAEKVSFGSACHGAGRRLSRSQAKKEWRGEDLIRQLWERGIRVRAATPSVAAEEAPEAYKDVSLVVDSVEAAGLARKAARLRPMGVVKG